jgi:hypothetical protein
MEEKLHHHLSEYRNEPAGHHMRFEVFMAMNTEIKIIWDDTMWSGKQVPKVHRNLLPSS